MIIENKIIVMPEFSQNLRPNCTKLCFEFTELTNNILEKSIWDNA